MTYSDAAFIVCIIAGAGAGINYLLSARYRAWRAERRFRRFTRPIDRQIEEARRRHRPTAHLLQAKRSLVEHSLRVASR